MEQRNLKINQISGQRKTQTIRDLPSRRPKAPRQAGEQGSIQRQVLSWDGLTAALSFSVPFIVVIAINFQSAVALALILAAVLLPISMLRFAMHEKLGFPDFLTVPVCAIATVGITAFASVIIRRYFPQINDSLGIYIYLFAAYPVTAAVFYGKHAHRIGTVIVWALRNIFYFSCAALLTGIIREFLAYNRFMGFTFATTFKMDAAKMPFFGFIVLAFVLAAATRIHMVVKARFPADEAVTTDAAVAADAAPSVVEAAATEPENNA